MFAPLPVFGLDGALIPYEAQAEVDEAEAGAEPVGVRSPRVDGGEAPGAAAEDAARRFGFAAYFFLLHEEPRTSRNPTTVEAQVGLDSFDLGIGRRRAGRNEEQPPR
jgi:hypothetical protein